MAVSPKRRSVAPTTVYRENIWILPPDAGSAQEPLYLDGCGITRKDPSYRIKRNKGSDYFVIEYIISGKGHLYCENTHLEPSAGDVYILPPNEPNEYYNSPSAPWEKIWFNVSGPLIEALMECYQLTGLVYCQETALEAEFRSGLDLVKNPDENIYSSLAGKLTVICSHLHRLRGGRQSGYSAEGMQMKTYLDSHWNNAFSLEDLSRLIDKSPAQTLRIFRSNFHTTPGRYFQKRRMQAAQRYLENTSTPIKDIAMLLGFANEFHFSAWFKKHNGNAPKHYRAQAYTLSDEPAD